MESAFIFLGSESEKEKITAGASRDIVECFQHVYCSSDTMSLFPFVPTAAHRSGHPRTDSRHRMGARAGQRRASAL